MKWKEVHNLTTIEDPEKIFLYHYIDSILGLKELEKCPASSNYYDLGSGAGFPGLIAAIIWPDKNIYLVETSKKKSSFLRLSASAMSLNRVKVLDQRVETLRDIPFAMTRAAFSPENWPLLEPALAPDGRIAFWLSDNIDLENVRENMNWALDYQSYYELEPGHRRQVAVFVSRGTSKKGKEAK
jgi:16S rRNA (guanine527-N7)-methyltransferase